MAVRQCQDGLTHEAAEAQFMSFRGSDYEANVKHIVSLLGHFDVCAVFEDDNHVDVYDFVKMLRARLGKTVRSTTTFISVYPDDRPFPDSTVLDDATISVLGINCSATASDQTVKWIRSIPEILIADAVWGDFDVMALAVRGTTESDRPTSSVISELYDIRGIEKITTMRQAKD